MEFRLENADHLIVSERIGSIDEYLTYLNEKDIVCLGKMGSLTRRTAGAAWRSLVYRELGNVELGYNEAGSPVIISADAGVPKWSYIGVTHSDGYVAVIFSNTRCAIDIERTDRDFSRAATRFVSPQEEAFIGNPLSYPAIWCAKETMYKFSGRKGLDLIRDIRITDIDYDTGTIRATFENSENPHPHIIKMHLLDGHLITYMAANFAK